MKIVVDDAAERAWGEYLAWLRSTLESPACPRLAEIADAHRRYAKKEPDRWRRFLEEPQTDGRLHWLMSVARTVSERLRLLAPVFAELETTVPTIREVAFRWFADAGVAPERWAAIERRSLEDIIAEWMEQASGDPATTN